MSRQTIKTENYADLTMSELMERELPHRDSPWKARLCDAMLREGIASPTDLLGSTRKAFETKMSSRKVFNWAEMQDVVLLRKAMEKIQKGEEPAEGGFTSGRSRSREHAQDRHKGRLSTSAAGGRAMRRDTSRPLRGNGDSKGVGRGKECRRGYNRNWTRAVLPRQKTPLTDKPALWAAAEVNDPEEVRRLLLAGAKLEEKFKGWTPLMKAAEEGSIDVLRILLEHNAKKDAANKKGRTALSFAAAPSDKDTEPRATPLLTLRALLEAKADPSVQCMRGRTPKEYAILHNRTEALQVFVELSL